MRQRLGFAEPLTVSEQLCPQLSGVGWRFWFGSTPGVMALGAFMLNPMGVPEVAYQKLRGQLGMLPSRVKSRSFLDSATQVLQTLVDNSNVRPDVPLDLVLWADELPEEEVAALRQTFPWARLLRFSLTNDGPFEEVLEA